MLTREENAMLTQTGPGTPMGDLFRRFWMPVMIATELPGPDCDPKRLRVMSEDLIAFRDTSGRVGVVDAYCPHRGAPLFFGRNEEDGLRCVYHGWKFDVEGACVDLPNAPEGETFKTKVTITSYSAVEKGGIIWLYMGPKEKQPPLPGFRFMDVADSQRYAWKIHIECNYFQSMEGDLDASHGPFLHSILGDNSKNQQVSIRRSDPGSLVDKAPRYAQIEDTEYGTMSVTSANRPDGELYLSVSHWMAPAFTTAGSDIKVSQNNMRVPIDDKNCMFWRVRFNENEPLDEKELWQMKHGGWLYPPLQAGTYTGVDNIHNDYNIDRVAQRNYSFTGIKSFSTQDTALIESQRGPIMDRSLERLVSADEEIIRVRRHLLKMARDLQEGKDPASNPTGYNKRVARFNVPRDTDISAFMKGNMAVVNR
ncbi:MAG: aromatic ring-hydroxylating dioxygenase subunit alpha [Dehalococcoidia bacterium]|nr:aromatic ring-hydroxylating dioxygenase subunit alpha [Dehalococcoidia bacterium]